MPTSVSAFSHRRARADSTTSFAFYNEDEDEAIAEEEEAIYEDGSVALDLDDIPFGIHDGDDDDDEGSEGYHGNGNGNGYDDHTSLRRSSTHSRSSVHARLLRTDSGHTEASARGHGRVSQKLHMVNEDLTIVIAGFRTSRIGYALYALLCAATLGTAYLLLRWLPRWQVKLIGAPCPLRECDWVVLENQWGEFAILPISSRPYDRPLSTVFGAPEKMFAHFLEEDADPILSELRVLSYRYVRFFFNPFKDKFVVSTGWKDPSWRRVRFLRAGIDSDEKDERASVFGRNLIDIDQKSIPQLLVDEVGHPSLVSCHAQTRVATAAALCATRLLLGLY